MFEEIVARLQKRKIQLRTHHSLLGQIVTRYRSSSPTEFKFSLFDLLCAIGTCRTVADTKAFKFSIVLDYLEVFPRNTANELRILIKDEDDVERKQKISRNVGEGLSLVIAERLFNLEKSTITKIKRRKNQSKPDFMGFTPLLKVVWEAKGSVNPIGQSVIKRAKRQKRREPADVAFVSLTSLKSQSITEVRLEDPPALPLEGDNLNRQLSRILHYVNTFNFIGQAELGRYFNLLGKRFEKNRSFPEFGQKVELFEKIRDKSIRLAIKDWSFLGNIERIGDSSFSYVGFDENLLSVEGFLNFVDYREDFVFKQDKNTYTVTRDGICYGYVSDLAELRDLGFTREIDIQKIPYYRDSISIRDLDDMLHFQLVEHMRYLFAREGFHVRKEVFEGNKRHDLIASKERKKYIVEVKKGIKEDVIIKSLEQITRYRNAGAALLVTTTKISDEYIRYAREMNIIIIDRRYLKAIIRNQASISDLLKKPIT